jgi:hypothetical protein
VQIVTTACDRAAIEPDAPFIRDVVAIGIAEFPNVRRGSDIDGSFMDEDTFRERQVLGEDSRVIKFAIPVTVDQSQDAVLRVFELSRRFVGVPGTVGEIEHAVVIETHVNRPLHQRRRGDTL